MKFLNKALFILALASVSTNLAFAADWFEVTNGVFVDQSKINYDYSKGIVSADIKTLNNNKEILFTIGNYTVDCEAGNFRQNSLTSFNQAEKILNETKIAGPWSLIPINTKEDYWTQALCGYKQR